MNPHSHFLRFESFVSIASLVWLMGCTAPVQAQQQRWIPTGSYRVARFGHSTTLLANGKVLVAGGSRMTSAELYDPATGQWSPTGSMISRRGGHIAVRLNSGKVLVAGGDNGYFDLVASAEIYDPETGEWSETGSFITARAGASATLLADGRVLVAGGAINQFIRLNSAELYDPATGVWSQAGAMNAKRHYSTATLLPDGKVLVAGGSLDSDPRSSELYDPATGSWSVTGRLSYDRFGHAATLLPNGKVLVAGGGISGDDWCNGVNKAELYDPATGRWSVTGSPITPRRDFPMTLLPNGKALIVGGAQPGCEALNSSELYDTETGSWSASGDLNTARYGHTLTVLTNGRVLAVGGSGDNSAELFDSGTAAAVSVSAASLVVGAALAPESIAAALGTNLATDTQSAPSLPLPTELARVRVTVRDRVGAERLAPLFFVSPTQIKYQVPTGTATGLATVTVTSGDGIVAVGFVEIASVAPGLFSANSNGQGVAAALVSRIKADGAQRFEPVARFDSAQNRYVAEPIDLGPETDQVLLILYGSGIRFRTSLSAVSATGGGVSSEVMFAGDASRYVGLDQVNVRLPRSLVGRGEVDVTLSVDGKSANPVRVNIR